ncbi:MAG: hypothetical protein NZ455_04690 [Bacteroidia bacterium]|nr:hypothetical protein [Bacteroidia bacterium]MDW8346130.1 hypothetical protein [Bacteroidia bacterium]
MRRASREAWCEAPCPHFYVCPGVGGSVALKRSIDHSKQLSPT